MVKIMDFISNSLQATDDIAHQIASQIKPGDIIAFSGDLGVGKTTLTRSIVKYLGSDDFVSSPTFSLVNHYKAKNDIFHFDMYRITNEDELYSTGFFDYIDDKNIIIIEWFENIKSFFNNNSIKIKLTYIDENSRKITITSNGDDRFWNH